jgi:hypothetical protein
LLVKSLFCGPTVESKPDFCSKLHAESESGLRFPPRGTQHFLCFASHWCCWRSFCNGVITACMPPYVAADLATECDRRNNYCAPGTSEMCVAIYTRPRWLSLCLRAISSPVVRIQRSQCPQRQNITCNCFCLTKKRHKTSQLDPFKMGHRTFAVARNL